MSDPRPEHDTFGRLDADGVRWYTAEELATMREWNKLRDQFETAATHSADTAWFVAGILFGNIILGAVVYAIIRWLS